MTDHYDTIIIGGGASGMAAAITSAENGRKTLLIEKSDRLGRKLSASGNGRCNMMNTGSLKYYGNTEFAGKVMGNCTTEDLIRFFRKYGLFIREENEGRVYPATMQSLSVLHAMQAAMQTNHVDILLRTAITDVADEGGGFVCKTENRTITAEKLVICAGGAACKKLGGTYDGYGFLQSFGHRYEEVYPSLVPVITDSRSISGLSGTRVRCSISLMDQDNLLHHEKGEVLFTDYGLSGICVMQCSRFIRKKGLHFQIDLLSDFFREPDDAVKEMESRRKTFGGLPPVILLEGILLPRLSYAVLKQAGIPLRGETAGSLSDEELKQIVRTAYHYKAAVTGTRTLEEAQVTAGGICCDEFDPQTMESLIKKGLYAAGEVLNVDGDCGGYNLMFAFSSGRIAGGFSRPASFVPEETQ